jgi:hypothetical protein
MRQCLPILLAVFMVAGLTDDAFAKRSGGRSSFSRPSPRKTTRPAPRRTPKKTTPAPTRKVAPSAFGKKTETTKKTDEKATTTKTATTATKTGTATTSKTGLAKTATTKKAVAPSKLTSDIQKKNAASTTKYGTGKEGRQKAAQDFRSSQEWKSQSQGYTNSNRYESATPPSTRPSYIPQDAVYRQLPTGGYGYVRMRGDRVIILDDDDWLIDDGLLAMHGYGLYGAHMNGYNATLVRSPYYGTHVVRTQPRVVTREIVTDPEAQRTRAGTGRMVAIFFIILIGAGAVVGAAVLIKRANG